ncbi:TRAP transporter small permease subunit [Kordiimonas lacus]|uniref:TRAP transporter small permease protein n=1 Tax=Kordiimonas lacus TaxID=637679 RepID=A0A1G7C8V2_9PROT|nr:TRAP transporter small permease subunit [Kordiimonas lacus]SDE35643.1 TRAP-type mannitol/chloroaromatic compound transport system, small permease component [Kordiimonas lacus]
MTARVVEALDAFQEKSGHVLAILPLALVLIQFAVVLMVYVFATGSIQLQESLQYINAMMFLGGAGYTAVKDGHVRVDIFYSRMSERGQAIVNFFGTLLLLVPFLILFWISALPYVLDSWSIMETSVEASGLPFVYILKSTLLLFALTLSLHAVADLIRFGGKLKRRT